MDTEIYLVGAGMGTPGTLTGDGKRAVEESRLIIGAGRLLAPYSHKNCRAHVLAEDIVSCIERESVFPVTVLLSGDVGFYSGAAALREKLSGYRLEAIPGVSSLAYFCAKLETSWQDVCIVSAHGRSHNAAGMVQSHRRTFILTGSDTAADLCSQLCENGLGGVSVTVGDRLGYDDERIVSGTALALSKMSFSSLAVMLAENKRPVLREYNSPGIPDGRFARGEAPMTKREVRTLAVSKLRILPRHILWDVGAGTGSVSVECALAACAGRVFAVERKPGAADLIEENKRRFGVSNLQVVSGDAPGALEELPAPDGVFLGGTAGRLGAIIEMVLRKNPHARLVAAAVTLETLGEAVKRFGEYGIADVDIVQVAVTQARSAGRYHMMEANNPVWLISGGGAADEE